jgi:uncharacterized protein
MNRYASFLALPLVAVLFQPASAFDCSKAKTAVETAICATPDLKARDDDLAAAYAALKAVLPPLEQKMLMRSQRRWIARRENCSDSVNGVTACIARQTGDRLSLLSGRPESGPGAAGRLQPQFIVQDGTAQSYDLNIAVLRFASPATVGEKALNAIAEDELRRVKLGKHGEETGGAIYADEDIWSLTYASPAFISIRRDFYVNTGGAHGNYGTTNINLDMSTGRELVLAGVLTDSAAAILTLECRRQLITARKKRLQTAGDDEPVTVDDAAVAEGVRNLASWSIGARQTVVNFDPYAVGSYAEGAYSCRFPTAGIRKLALPGAPLP